MQKIVPNLWFDHNAMEAVDFYVSVFDDSKINSSSHYPKSKEEGLADFQKDLAGEVLTVNFQIGNYEFVAINADSTFKPNPSVSFFYSCETTEEMDMLWKKLSHGGKSLMELSEYPFSKYYGWIQDRFGYSWQLMLSDPEGDKRPKIVPSLMFTKDKDGMALEAMEFYTSVFKESEVSKNINKYPKEMPDREGKISYADFRLADQWFAVMDGGPEHEFKFNEAISFAVFCSDQEEIDYYWEKLSSVPESEQCGWCKDKFGVSWQIMPSNMEELMNTKNSFDIMMNQKKIIISEYK